MGELGAAQDGARAVADPLVRGWIWGAEWLRGAIAEPPQRLAEWAGQATGTVGSWAGQVTGAIAQTAEQTKTTATQFGQSFTVSPQGALAAMVQSWMAEHPVWAWCFTHPLITVGLGLVALVIVRRLVGLVVQGTERLLLAIVRSPLWLGKWLLGVGTGWFQRPMTALAEPPAPTQHQRLAMLLDRLEAIRREQDELLQEVRAILKSGQ